MQRCRPVGGADGPVATAAPVSRYLLDAYRQGDGTYIVPAEEVPPTSGIACKLPAGQYTLVVVDGATGLPVAQGDHQRRPGVLFRQSAGDDADFADAVARAVDADRFEIVALEQLIDGKVMESLAPDKGVAVTDADVDARLTEEATTPELRHAWMIAVAPASAATVSTPTARIPCS